MKKAIIITQVDEKLFEDFEDVSIDYAIMAKNKKDGGIYYFRYVGPAEIYERKKNALNEMFAESFEALDKLKVERTNK